jgi:hypothetical protein
LAIGRSRTRHCYGPATFKYLGVELHDVTGTNGSVEHHLTCMIATHSAGSRRLNDIQCPKDLVLVADLFDTITAGTGSYGL